MDKIIKIDTSDNKKISVILLINNRKTEAYSESTLLKSEACLPLLDSLLKKNKIDISKIDRIYVNEGPGSFTGLRVGASIANTLSYLLSIPINNRKIGELAFPVYNS